METTGESQTASGGNLRAMILIGVAWSVLCAFDVWLLLIRPDAAWDVKLGFVFGLIGVYSFAFGVVSATGLLDRMPRLGRELTSPNPTLFLASAADLLTLLFMALSLALKADRSRESFQRRGGAALYVIETPFVLLGFVIAFGFVAAYVLLVAPIAWIAHVITNIPLDSIQGSAGDADLQRVDPTTGSEETILTIKGFVDENLVTLRNLLVAVPSLVASLVLSAPALL